VITYTVTTGSGCVSQDTARVTVNALPQMVKTAGSRGVCVGSTITLSNASTGGTGVWSSSANGIATVDNNGVVRGVGAGNVVITYTVTTGSDCVSQDTARINVSALPQMVKTAGPREVCAGSTITLSNASTGGTGVWSSNNPGVATVDNNGVVRGAGAGNAVVSYTVTTGSGCISQDTARITVNA
ncbi:Ig-like domain-containing protein, partial [Filimonas zeae]